MQGDDGGGSEKKTNLKRHLFDNLERLGGVDRSIDCVVLTLAAFLKGG
jgi:hypothetical protein